MGVEGRWLPVDNSHDDNCKCCENEACTRRYWKWYIRRSTNGEEIASKLRYIIYWYGVFKVNFQEIVDNAYFAASKQNKWTSSPETREAFNVAFQRGAQWSARTSSQLAPHIAQFCEFMVWLTAYDNLPEETNSPENANFTKT